MQGDKRLKALYFDGEMKMIDMPAPEADGEAVVRVRMAGVCNTDVEISRGYMGFKGVPGHEFVGVVESAPDPKWVGRRVVGEINIGCGDCPACAAGMQRHCPNREVLGIASRDGAFAEYLRLPLANLREVQASMPDEVAVFTEPVAACFEMLEQAAFAPGEQTAVIGDGKLGLLAAQVLRAAGARVTIIGKHPEKMALASVEFGLDTVPVESARGLRFNTVVECSGKPAGLDLAGEITRPRGRIFLKSTYHGNPSPNTSLWVVNELTVIGSRCGLFPPALDALARGAVRTKPLIGAVFPFNDALDAFDAAMKPGALKILIDFKP